MEKRCGRCEYEWESKKENPKECPRCKARLDINIKEVKGELKI